MAYSTGVADPSSVGPSGPEPPEAALAHPTEPPPASAQSNPAVPVRVVDLDWRSVAVALAALVFLIAVTGLVRSAPHTLTAIAVGTLLALALNPLVNAAERRVGGRRAPAVAIVLSGFTLS